MYINDSVNNRLSTVIFLLAIAIYNSTVKLINLLTQSVLSRLKRALIFILHKGLGFKHHCGLIIERDLSKLKNFDC